MSDLNERELDLKDYLYYAFKEFSPKGGIWMKYLEHWDEAYTQLHKIVEEHFKYKYLDNDSECYHKADQEQGVDEELIERTLEKLSECCDVGYSYTQDREWGELDKEKAGAIIKQLLTRQPVESGWVWCPVCEKRIEVIDKRLQPVQVDEEITKWIDEQIESIEECVKQYARDPECPDDFVKELNIAKRIKQFLTQKRVVKG